MMDDLMLLREAWEQPEQPAPAAYAAARAGLLEQAQAAAAARAPGPAGRRQAYGHRARWLAGGLGLAAAAAGAAVLALGAPTPTATRSHGVAVGHHPARSGPSARQILLAAAVTAAARPTGSGTYWYVKTLDQVRDTPTQVTQIWTALDGQTWITIQEGTHKTTQKADNIGLWRDGGPITLQQIQQMPASPAALKAWVTRWLVNYESKADAAHGKPAVSAGQVDLAQPLADLLYLTPVRPQVRAAAFRVLASLPGIRTFQSPAGGVGLLLPEGFNLSTKLVIDPSTSQVRSVTYSAYGGGDKGVITVLAASWTNTPPTR
jgi:hypothetical protein